MKFSMLLPTLGSREEELIRLFDSLENQIHKNFEVIVVTQGNHEKVAEILLNYKFEYKHIPMEGRGIAIARNIGLPHINGDVLAFADDDGWYDKEALQIVKEHIEKYDPDIVTFRHIDPYKNEYTRAYPESEILGFKKMDTLKQMSLDIYININRVPVYIDGFDERFGVGSKYNSGEENIYLMDLYNKGYKKMYYFPIIIAYHPKKECNYLDEQSFIGKGPLFKRLFGSIIGLPMIIGFGLKKKNMIDEFSNGRFWDIYKKSITEFRQFKL